MQNQIFDMLLEKEDVTWRSILYDLVKTEQMNPWDVNITLLTQRYIGVIKEMKEHDFRISGKILLAAAFMLKMKSAYLLDHDISNLDKLLSRVEEDEDYDEDDFFEDIKRGMLWKEKKQFQLIPRNPQPRSRKVSIHDLVNALQKAMVSKKRVLARIRPAAFEIPKRNMDIMEVIRDVYHKLVYYLKKENAKKLSFTTLLPPKAGRQDKVYTFIPLLHLEHQRKVEMRQKAPFEEIHVRLMKNGKAVSAGA